MVDLTSKLQELSDFPQGILVAVYLLGGWWEDEVFKPPSPNHRVSNQNPNYNKANIFHLCSILGLTTNQKRVK